jgi:hypothetical protein
MLQGRIMKPEWASNMREMGTIYDTKITDYVSPDWNYGNNNRNVCEHGQSCSRKQIERLYSGSRVAAVWLLAREWFSTFSVGGRGGTHNSACPYFNCRTNYSVLTKFGMNVTPLNLYVIVPPKRVYLMYEMFSILEKEVLVFAQPQKKK